MQMKQFYEKVGLNIAKKRIEKGYSREMLAELVDISPRFLYEIETGRKGFSAEVYYKIVQALDVGDLQLL